VTETTDTTASPQAADSGADQGAAETGASRSRGRTKGLSSLVLPQLQQVAQQLGITGIARMRKSQLIEAIEASQAGGAVPRSAQARPAAKRASRTQVTVNRADESDNGAAATDNGAEQPKAKAEAAAKAQPAAKAEKPEKADKTEKAEKPEKSETNNDQGDRAEPDAAQAKSGGDQDRGGDQRSRRESGRDRDNGRNRDGNREGNRESGNRDSGRDGARDGNRDGGRDGNRESGRDGGRDGGRDRNAGRQDQGQRDDRDRDDDGDGSGRRRRRRGRDRFGDRDDRGDRNDRNDRGGRGGRNERGNRRERYDPEPALSDDDVLIPVAGILDVLDNYAFVRTSGFLPGPNDVYVSLAMVKKYGLRKGDAVSGVIRQPKDGERREKFNPLVRVDTVNGADPELSKQRADFGKLTPLYPQDRLRLESEASNLTTRIIDLICPIGKGQRALIVSPAKAGKTLIMQAIANAITQNNPEAHLMVVLVDERPEEVTDMQRAVKGEVISSTFDRPADDHTTVAELAIERAKRLVELGHDVVVLLDSITRLGRAYNIAAPASGRILSGGVDSSALYPPKRFFGAARNIENGGSLTIIATALIETGSKADEVIFEEFKGTGNMELRLRREYADKRIFPAIDVDQSSTRREELLMTREELAIVWKLRRVLSGLDGQQALELLLNRLKDTRSNVEFLMQINKTMPLTGGSSARSNGDND
jgi:transcription termination factor Rho